MEFLVVLAIAIAAIFLLFKFFKGLFKKRPGDTITGKAYVTDGDGVKVSGYTIRLAGLDAPEWDQLAKHQHGYWFNEGKRVKSALIRAIGGKYVRVTVEAYDKYGRVVGTVTCNGKDVGEWLVLNGLAIAAYGDRYKHLQREARKTQRGRWGYAEAYDPRAWRHGIRIPGGKPKPPRRTQRSYERARANDNSFLGSVVLVIVVVGLLLWWLA